MEKQPVDDLFARKLRDADLTPGADVFGRLQSRLNATPLPVAEPKRRLAGWWYGVAASALLGVVWLSWSPERDASRPAGHRVAQSDALSTRSTSPESGSNRTEPQATVATADASPATSRTAEPQMRQTRADDYVAKVTETKPELVEKTSLSATLSGNVPDKSDLEAPLATTIEKSPPAVADASKIPTGRTVILTIAEPEPANVAALQPVRTDAANSTPNLSHFFDKVKQIKSGEVFARATPARPAAEPKTGLGRLVNGVRESLRNETTLEP